MTNLDNLVSAIQSLAAKENDTRFRGNSRLKLDVRKLETDPFQFNPLIYWHSGIPNHLCAFVDWFDDEHCAAYCYLWEQDNHFKCTLTLSNMDPAGPPEDLPYIPKSLDDYQIARHVIASVIAGTERMKARGGTIEQIVRPERG